jgi:hypothetical protein
MKKIACCVFSYEITKGMKSYGSIGLLKRTQNSKELICCTVDYLQNEIKHKDIYVILGFEEDKIKKKLKDYHFKGYCISNLQYEAYNTGHAFKLMLNHIADQLDHIDGILFTNGNILLKKMPKFYHNKSWILVDKIKNKETFLGCRLKDNNPEYIFYNIGDVMWTEVFFIASKDLKEILKKQTLYHDHMFGFEIINTAMEKQHIVFETLHLDKTKNLVKINGLKDKLKVK